MVTSSIAVASEPLCSVGLSNATMSSSIGGGGGNDDASSVDSSTVALSSISFGGVTFDDNDCGDGSVSKLFCGSGDDMSADRGSVLFVSLITLSTVGFASDSLRLTRSSIAIVSAISSSGFGNSGSI